MIILSRSETLCKLIKIRKKLYNKKECSEIKKEIDKLLLEIIGVSKDNQYKINDIIHKAITDEIKARTAVVAIHEIVIDNKYSKIKSNKKKKNNLDELEELYRKGYR